MFGQASTNFFNAIKTSLRNSSFRSSDQFISINLKCVPIQNRCNSVSCSGDGISHVHTNGKVGHEHIYLKQFNNLVFSVIF